MRTRTLWCVALTAFLTPPAHADLITEFFNNYGTTTTVMHLRGAAGGGWAGSWTGDLAVDYKAGSQLSYGFAGYNNAGNETGADDGAAGHGGGNATNRVQRAIDINPGLAGNQGLTGTVWISALMRYDTTSRDALLWLDLPDAATNYIGLAGTVGTTPLDGIPEPIIRYAGADDTAATADAPVGATHLILARIVMNDGGVNDTISFWVNPTLAGGEAGLGAPAYTKAGSDAFGTEFSGVGISFQAGTERLDAIRISNNPTGFLDVTAVPEPSALLLAGLAGAAAWGLRRLRPRSTAPTGIP